MMNEKSSPKSIAQSLMISLCCMLLLSTCATYTDSTSQAIEREEYVEIALTKLASHDPVHDFKGIQVMFEGNYFLLLDTIGTNKRHKEDWVHFIVEDPASGALIDCIIRNEESVVINNLFAYKEPRIRIWGKGVITRGSARSKLVIEVHKLDALG